MDLSISNFVDCKDASVVPFLVESSRNLQPSSRNLRLKRFDMMRVLLLLLVSFITSIGTKPYLSIRLATPVNCPPSPMGFLKSHSTFLSSNGRFLVSMTACRKRFAFSNWSQKKIWTCENWKSAGKSCCVIVLERKTFIPVKSQQRPDDF